MSDRCYGCSQENCDSRPGCSCWCHKDNMTPVPASATPSTPTQSPAPNALSPNGVPYYDPTQPPAVDPLAALTAREKQVALALACESTNREIAAALQISIKTVDTHRGHVLRKLGLKNNVALTRLLIRIGAVQP